MPRARLARVIDPVLLRENPELVKRSQELRGESSAFVDDAVAADAARRAAITAFEALRAEQNAFGKQVAQAPKDEKAALVAAGAGARRAGEGRQPARDRRRGRRSSAPCSASSNVVIDGVPAGGEDDFVVLREVGEIPAFDFEPRDHLEIGELLDAIDMERGAKVVGRALPLPQGHRRPPRARAHEHGPRPRARRRVHPAHHADARAARDHAGHRIPRRARRRDLPPPRRRPLPHRHERGRARRLPRRRDPRPLQRAAALRRLVDLLPPRGRVATARTPAASSACTSSTSSRCSATSTRRMPRPSTSACSRCRRACCRRSASATA